MRDWEEACRASKYNMAVSERKQFEFRGKMYEGEIIKPRYSDGRWCYAGRPGSKTRKATPAEVDGMRRWTPY